MSTHRLDGRRRSIVAWACAVTTLIGCGSQGTRHPDPAVPDTTTRAAGPAGREIPIEVLADSGRGGRLPVRPPTPEPGPAPRARAWLALAAAPPDAGAELPVPPSDTTFPSSPTRSETEARLEPPIPVRAAVLRLPSGMKDGAAVELDVRVDADGRVSEVRWAGGTRDSSLIAAAERCARAMQFYPALLAGRPVAVWCRQRLEISP